MGVVTSAIGIGLMAAGQIQQGQAAGAAAKANATSALMQGRENSIAAEYNAAVARANAEAIKASVEIDIGQQKKAAKALRGTQLARYASSGVKLEGSPLEVIIDSSAEAIMGMAITEYNAKTSASQADFAAREFTRSGKAAMGLAETQAANQRMIGKYYINQGYTSGAGTLLNAGADFYKPSSKLTTTKGK